MSNLNKIFPIKTKTACILKWAWSTIYLGQGKTSSCHRVDQYPIDPNNFANFHNQPEKIAARETMLKGEWPQAGCQYCQKIEEAGGMSDRQYQLHETKRMDHIPKELFTDPTTTEVVPTVLEIYFNNVCNMSCLYCGSWFSTKWEEENKKFGRFKQGNVDFGYNKPQNENYEKMLADFWKYLEENDRYKAIRYYQILGGEPFFQKEFDTSIEFWENHPNPDVAFNIITNLKVPPKKFKAYIDRFGKMVEEGKLSRLQITGSLDAWGPQEEYVRWGLDLKEWEENFTYLLDKPWIVMVVNMAVSGLTIKTMPGLIEKIKEWNQHRDPWNRIYFSFMTVTNPHTLVPDIFGAGVFEEDFQRIYDVWPTDSPDDLSSLEHMKGIQKQIEHKPRNVDHINDLKTYLTEIDRRRDTNWKELFPWLDKDWS
jgi:pyruvate-formate lyase-activating enzyme